MENTANERTLRKRRKWLTKRGMARFEVAGEPPKTGGILAALRRSPLVGANLNLARSRDTDG